PLFAESNATVRHYGVGQPANHAVRNAKMSATCTPFAPSKSEPGTCPNQAERNAKISATVTTPLPSKSAGHGLNPMSSTHTLPVEVALPNRSAIRLAYAGFTGWLQ